MPLQRFIGAFKGLGAPTNRRPRPTRRTVPNRLRLESLDERESPSGIATNLATLDLPIGQPAPSGICCDFSILDQYNLYSMSGSQLSITNPQTKIAGNVGLGAYAKQNFSDGQIGGSFIIDYTTNNSHSNNVRIAGGTQKTNTAPVDAAAFDASAQIAAMPSTQSLGAVSNSATINGNGHINVIKLTSLQLDGSSSLTLKGGANDFFFINDSGKFAMTGTSSIQLNGVQQNHVLFNITGSGEQVAFTGKSVGEGTFLAVNRDIAVSGATVVGQLIGGYCHNVSITSAAQICGCPFQPPCCSSTY
jgi:hypothetical protein